MIFSNSMTVFGLLNGMIGGVILVVPLLALKTGWAIILPVCLFSGFTSYFTCTLCLRHLKNFQDLDISIYYHFGKKASHKIFYDVIILISMTTLLILYFSLICKQWAGIFGQSKLISIINALVLFPMVYVLRKYNIGASILAYGIFSIIGYVVFLFWLILTTDPGPKTLPVVHKNFVDLAAALTQGFSIQNFFIPILKKNAQPNLYKKVLSITYLIGFAIYLFIAYGGAASLVNRKFYKSPETIQDYFKSASSWEVVLLEIIYLIHLYSTFPQFLLIAKERFFSIFKWPEPQEVSIKQVIFTGVTILLALIIKLTQLSITVIIQLNGSIVSFFFVYAIPIALHLKCVYFTKPSERHSMLNEQQKKTENLQEMKKSVLSQEKQASPESGACKLKVSNQIHSIQPLKQTKSIDKFLKSQSKQVKQIEQSDKDSKIKENSHQEEIACQCDIKFKSKFAEYSQLIFLGIMFIAGLLIMGYTLYLLIKGQKE